MYIIKIIPTSSSLFYAVPDGSIIVTKHLSLPILQDIMEAIKFRVGILCHFTVYYMCKAISRKYGYTMIRRYAYPSRLTAIKVK